MTYLHHHSRPHTPADPWNTGPERHDSLKADRSDLLANIIHVAWPTPNSYLDTPSPQKSPPLSPHREPRKSPHSESDVHRSTQPNPMSLNQPSRKNDSDNPQQQMMNASHEKREAEAVEEPAPPASAD
ncbi:hypothetical protein IMZ48_24705, partial [Candidatus Bathyarchaeota archaeon]|nr:hypothetical protein [Candidatus Bathyarchaeota archaeon]